MTTPASAAKYSQVTDVSSVVTFGQTTEYEGAPIADVDVPNRATFVHLQAEDQDIRYRADGNDPAAGVGMILKAGAEPTIIEGRQALLLLRFLEDAAGATLNIHFYGNG